MNRKTLLICLTLAVTVLASACSSSSPKIAITTAPPASMEVNTTASITATTTHDSGKGVDWSCSPAGSCGTFSPAHTDSGAATLYTAPSTAGDVTITAASTKKASVTATASVTITPVATTSSLNGTYTFFFTGTDINDSTYSVAGSVAIDGAGNITGGEQDSFDAFNPTICTADPIAAGEGAVVIGDDGRGTITLTPTCALPETLSVVVVNDNHLLVTEFDGNATSTGSLDLQTAPTSLPTGGNAFTVFDAIDAFTFGGVITSDGAALITDGEADDDLQGTVNFDFALTGSLTAPDAAGRGTITIIDPNFVSFPFTFAYYVVGPEAFRLVAIDGNTFAAGSMYGQGTAAGAFSSASLSNSFVFGLAGDTDVGIGADAAAGQLTTDATSLLTAGVADVNEGDGAPVAAGDLTDSTYFVNANGYGGISLIGGTTGDLFEFGVYAVDPALNVADPNSAADVGGGLMTDLDADALGAGVVVPQSSGASFAGNYAISQDGIYVLSDGVTFSFFDLVGTVFSDGSSTLTGVGDYNDIFNTGLNSGVSITGTFAADGANPGRATAQVTINGGTPNSLAAYQASSALVLHVDVDSAVSTEGTVALGLLEQQQ